MTMFERIEFISKKRGMSLREVNEKAKLGTNAIYRWKKQTPSVDKIKAVAKRVGHVDTTTTQKVYAHLLKEQEEKEDEKTMELLGLSPNVPKDSDKARYNKG